jgi:threonine/homoserine/homoserine lactone efflux protein
MDRVIPVAALITLAAITPGPNNVIIMSRAVTGGLSGVLGAILAIVGASLIMLLAAMWLMTASSVERVAPWIAVAGCLMLVVLAVQQFFQPEEPRAPPPWIGVGAIAGFQWVNPKAWILVTIPASVSAGGGPSWILLMVLFAVITTTCLLLWASFGSAISIWANSPRRKRWVDRILGATLLATAVQLACSQIGGLT